MFDRNFNRQWFFGEFCLRQHYRSTSECIWSLVWVHKQTTKALESSTCSSVLHVLKSTIEFWKSILHAYNFGVIVHCFSIRHRPRLFVFSLALRLIVTRYFCHSLLFILNVFFFLSSPFIVGFCSFVYLSV